MKEIKNQLYLQMSYVASEREAAAAAVLCLRRWPELLLLFIRWTELVRSSFSDVNETKGKWVFSDCV